MVVVVVGLECTPRECKSLLEDLVGGGWNRLLVVFSLLLSLLLLLLLLQFVEIMKQRGNSKRLFHNF